MREITELLKIAVDALEAIKVVVCILCGCSIITSIAIVVKK